MFFTIALVLLISWLVGVLGGVFGVFDVGQAVHVLLLAGLLFLLLAVTKRDDTNRNPKPNAGGR